jgi:hypothetical protein
MINHSKFKPKDHFSGLVFLNLSGAFSIADHTLPSIHFLDFHETTFPWSFSYPLAASSKSPLVVSLLQPNFYTLLPSPAPIL